MNSARIVIDGLVGRDPDISVTPTGIPVARFSVAVDERRKQEDGTYATASTTWFECECWRGLAEGVGDTIRKGDRVLVEGRFKLDQWTGRDGDARVTAAVNADSVGLVPKAGRTPYDQSPY